MSHGESHGYGHQHNGIEGLIIGIVLVISLRLAWILLSLTFKACKQGYEYIRSKRASTIHLGLIMCVSCLACTHAPTLKQQVMWCKANRTECRAKADEGEGYEGQMNALIYCGAAFPDSKPLCIQGIEDGAGGHLSTGHYAESCELYLMSCNQYKSKHGCSMSKIACEKFQTSRPRYEVNAENQIRREQIQQQREAEATRGLSNIITNWTREEPAPAYVPQSNPCSIPVMGPTPWQKDHCYK